MKGSVFSAFRTLVTERYGAALWSESLQTADAESAIYLPLESYPDEVLARIAAAVSVARGEPLDDLLFALGRHLAVQLHRSHPTLFRAGRTAEQIARLLGPPPESKAVGYLDLLPLRFETSGSGELLARFGGVAPLCMLAKGVVSGMAREANERVAVFENQCQKRGAPVCVLRLVFAKVAEPAVAPAGPPAALDGDDITVIGGDRRNARRRGP